MFFLEWVVVIQGSLSRGQGLLLKKVATQRFHETPMRGHAGIQRTYLRLAANVFWDGMKKDVKEYIGHCYICQTVKYPTEKPYGLLQPTELPERV